MFNRSFQKDRNFQEGTPPDASVSPHVIRPMQPILSVLRSLSSRNVRSCRNWKPKHEGATVFRRGDGFKRSTVSFHDRPTDRQAHAHSAALRREEWIEDP